MMLSGLEERIALALINLAEKKREKFENICQRFFSVGDKITFERRENINSLLQKIIKSIKSHVKDKSTTLKICAEKLNALSPLSVLSRGYAIPETEKGVIRSVDDVKCGENLSLHLKDGTLTGKIEKIKRGFNDE